MCEPSFNIRGRDRPQSGGQGLPQCVARARLGRAQGRLDLRPAQFDRVVVGRVGRQKDQPCATGFNQMPRRLAFVSRQVIHQHHVASLESLHQFVFDVRFKRRGIHGSFQNPGGQNTFQANGRDERIVRARLVGRRFIHAHPRFRTTEHPRHPQVEATFIEEFQVFEQSAQFIRDARAKRVAQRFHARRVPLTVVKRLFFSPALQALQGPVHHAGTRDDLVGRGHTLAQFSQRHIGLLLDCRAQEIIVRPEGRLGPMGQGQRSATVCLASETTTSPPWICSRETARQFRPGVRRPFRGRQSHIHVGGGNKGSCAQV